MVATGRGKVVWWLLEGGRCDGGYWKGESVMVATGKKEE